ncbi:MAG: lysozyme [Paraprevotella sp.]|nr:lysozyme [Paraprevotella sp.]
MKTNLRVAISALTISAAGLVSIASYESYRGEAYRDSGGVPTIGYGETKGVKMGQRTTPERALVQLLKSADTHTEEIKKCIKVPLYQYEMDAYASFAYNIGSGSFCKSTLVKKLNAGDYEGACKEMTRWNKVKGVVNKGLINRRQKEAAMCLGGE